MQAIDTASHLGRAFVRAGAVAALAALVLAAGPLTPGARANTCAMPGLDVNQDGVVTDDDQLCMRMTLLAEILGLPKPGCAPEAAMDFDCDGDLALLDLAIQWRLYWIGVLPWKVDADGDGCADSCQTPSECVDGAACDFDSPCLGQPCGDDQDLCVSSTWSCELGLDDGFTLACQTGPVYCDNGLFCDGLETCDPSVGCVDGQPPQVDDGIDCTFDWCDDGAMQVFHEAIDGLCDDEVPCTDDACDPDAGGCVNVLPPGSDDGLECTVSVCDPATGQVSQVPDDGLCDPIDPCTPAVCDPFVGCVPGVNLELDDGVDCTIDACDPATGEVTHTPQDGLCDSGSPCYIGSCDPADGGCVIVDSPAIDDGIECTLDICDDVSGDIFHIPVDAMCPSPGPCGTSVCVPNQGCQAYGPPELDDGIACTIDTCDETGTISHTPDDGLCNDQLFCNGVELCDPDAGGCVDGEPPFEDDFVDCTVPLCDEDANAIVHVPSDSLCDNLLFCDGVESCDPDVGCTPGQAPDPSDGIDCTVDTCDDASGGFVHTPNHGLCDNFLFCDGDEICAPDQGGCIAGDPPEDLDDGVPCTLDVCSEEDGVITHTPDDSLCDNGKVCDGVEVCSAFFGTCLPGQAVDPDDGIDCTEDVCDDQQGGIVNTPNHALCDNQLLCDGQETCVPADGGCVDGPAPDPADEHECTFDYCDDAEGGIVHVPIDEICDNGVFCDGLETCTADAGCVAGDEPDVDDGFPCTTDLCDAVTDQIVHIPDDALCDNLQFCDGVEVCVPGQGCVDGPDPDLDDAVPCTIDTCNEETDEADHTPDHSQCEVAGLCKVGICDPVFELGGGCIEEIVLNCCGNTLIEGDETCDDGNDIDGDGCSADCVSENPQEPDCPIPDLSCFPFADDPPQPVYSRWVGLLPPQHQPLNVGDPCPPPVQNQAMWLHGRLFKQAPPAVAQFGLPEDFIQGNDEPGSVACFYEWQGNGPLDFAEVDFLAQDLPVNDLFGTPIGPWLHGDPPVVVPLAPVDDLRDDLKGVLHDHALGQAGAVPAPPAGFPGATKVYVGVLDTALPDPFGGVPGFGQSPHGRDVGTWIRELACPSNSLADDACAVYVDTHLALHLEPDGLGGSIPNYALGGFYGTPSQLARAAWDAVLTWAAFPPGTGLVLNFSVGWEDDPAGAPVGSLPTEIVRAIHGFAACGGGISIAAAGNHPDGPGSVIGPMLPAGFEPGAPPSCIPGSASYKAVVHSVGGLSGSGAPLASTREGGRPRLAAYALQVASDASFTTDGFPLDPVFDSPSLTGTSMAAATTSAALALAWYHAGPIPGNDVMDMLYEAGAPLASGDAAEYCLGGGQGCPAIRRVDVCETLNAVVGTGPPCVAPVLEDPQWLPGQAATAGSLATASFTVVDEQEYPLSQCASGYVVHGPAGLATYPEYPCPERQLYNFQVQPNVDPQPRGPGCDVCAYDPSTGMLTVMISETLAGDGPISEVRVSFTAPDATVDTFLVDGSFSAGDVLVVDGLPPGLLFDFVEISGKVTGISGREIVRSEQVAIQASPGL